MKRTLCSTLIAGLFAVASHAGAADDHPKAAAASGVDVKAIDSGVRA